MFSDDFFFVKPKHPCERHLQPRYAGIHLPQLRPSASVPIWEAGTAAMAEVAGGITVATIECDGEIVCEAPAIAHEKLGFVSGSCNSSTSAEEERRARVAWLEQLRRQCGSEQEFETARSQPTWTQVASTSSCSAECGPSSAELERLRVENKLHFQRLVETHPLPSDFHPFEDGWNEFDNLGRTSSFFFSFGGRLETGRKIGGGGQAEIYEALFDGEVDEYHVLKVFRSDYSLAELQRQWMTEIGSTSMLWKSWDGLYLKVCFIRNGMLLEDGRFAFVMRRHWGDLRKAIDLQIVKDKTHQSPPFPLSVSIDIMHQIATGMRRLHANDILHRDLKAANVLVNKEYGKGIEEETFDSMQLLCYVADFESCEGVMGTGFWRAPEVLLAMKSKGIHKFSDGRIWTKKVDVYSYAMTCYEVLTGCIPFQNRVANDYDSIIEGERPPLPDYVDHEMQNLLERCWHGVPSIRPTFDEICGELDTFISKKRKV